jgi:hypothetical protein
MLIYTVFSIHNLLMPLIFDQCRQMKLSCCTVYYRSYVAFLYYTQGQLIKYEYMIYSTDISVSKCNLHMVSLYGFFLHEPTLAELHA